MDLNYSPSLSAAQPFTSSSHEGYMDGSAGNGGGLYAYPSCASNLDFMLLKERLKLLARSFQPSIVKRKMPRQAEIFQLQQELGIRIPDWHQLKKHKATIPRTVSAAPSTKIVRHPEPSMPLRHNLPKITKAVKCKSNTPGRTYTSKYRGVHQTFPTKRWEAQFRRNGKPTSLGCFDHEEEAARAYDKMMLWCELHNTAGVKGGITNFDPAEYEKDIAWLQSITQDELIESLRSDGRRQAAHRMLRQKREGQSASPDEENYNAGDS